MRSTTPALRGSFLGEFVSFRPEGGRRSFSGRDRSARRGCSDYSLISSVPFPSLIRLLRFLVFRRGLDNGGRGGGGTESMGLRRERVERVRAPLPPSCNATSIPETEAGPRLASVFINVVPV